MRIRRTFWAILAVLLFGVAGYATTAAKIYLRLMYLGGFLIALSYLWTLLSLKGVAVKRTARFLRQQVGQVFEERFELNNAFPMTKLWIEIRDHSSLPGQTGSKVLTWIGPRQRRSYIAYTRLTQRGQFLLGPTTLTSGDPFGLFSVSKTFPNDRMLLVLPYSTDLSRLPLPAGVLPGGRALRRKTLEVTPYAAGVREYAPGDALNRIHWPTTARKDRLMVKEFDQDPQADVWILVDAQRSVQISLPDEEATQPEHMERQWIWRQQYKFMLPNHTFEYSVSAAASMAKYYIEIGRSVGLASAGQMFMVLPAERGERQLGKLLEVLAHLNPDGQLPLDGVVEAQAPHLTRGSTVVLITPALSQTIDAAVEELMHRDLEPVVVMIDRTTFKGFGNAQELSFRLRARKIPAIIVPRGENIRLSLESEY